MHCPYCREQLTETDRECPNCQLSLNSANALLAPMPHYDRGLTDRQNALDKSARKRLRLAMADLQRKFPQVDLHILIQDFNPKFPLPTHLFWLFNAGGFCPDDRKGGKNHSILIGLDTRQGRIGLIPGYGLEPFLPIKALDHILETAHPHLAEGNYARALLNLLLSLDSLMTGICEDVESNFGIKLPQTATSSASEY